jgi:hypothetical protein
MRKAVVTYICALSNLQAQIKDLGTNEKLQQVRDWFDDLDSILRYLESEQRSPSEEAMLLDAVDIILNNAVQRADSLQKFFEGAHV